ncbi:hypothetical protein Cni_G04086 [Canna indica]|uniref:DUF3741 domain-containing protein n=1 Tax=Canna indica TaxID=4628 RepID=A0AAQ3Q454_9LILI|nr:hypothetical protein Cni_G04086 [Canna indica]
MLEHSTVIPLILIPVFLACRGLYCSYLGYADGHGLVVRNSSAIVKDPIYPVESKTEGKHSISEQRSSPPNKKSGGTPIKMLISQEMWGDTESRQKPPNVVARLMGLDSLPAHQSVITAQKGRDKGSLSDSLTEFRHCNQHEGGYVDKYIECDSQSSTEEEAFRDVYEVQQQPSKNVWIREQSPQRARCDENFYQRRMAFVRQKFIEAKRLATNEKFIDSKEFQDAVEVLNSNRDLFIKFLEEPNSMFTRNLFEPQSMSIPSQKTRITVLKPSGAMEKNTEKNIERQLIADSAECIRKVNKHYWSSGLSEPKGHNLSQPTRIVVLKPSPAKPSDISTTLPNNFPKLLGDRISSGAMVDDELAGSREVAKEITRQMRESLSNNKDEAFLSSVLSNGYIGDESSFNRSESEYMADEAGSISDSEITTLATEYSCDYINKIGSPFSASSISRVSHTPESSVIREAKKRLSERLALVASNDNSQDQRQLRRTSSTLGEMLAIPELKNEGSEGEIALGSSRSPNGENDPKVPSMLLSTFVGGKDEHTGDDYHRNLSRSKSVPLSSSACEFYESNGGISSALINEPIVQKEIPKTNSGRSSFRDKVSSFFFSRSKKPSGEKFFRSSSVQEDRVGLESSNGCGKTDNDLLQSSSDSSSAEISPGPEKLQDGSTEGMPSPKGTWSLEKPGISGNFTRSQDQSSQISVSDTSFVDDVNNGVSPSNGSSIVGRPQALSRSPPIESVARSLSWGSSYLSTASSKPLKPSMIFFKADEEHEQFVFVRKLITSAGIDNKKSMVFGRWHSLDSPLNPSLLYEYLQMDEEEGKCRESRSSHRLLFDAVNAALLDISQCELRAACHGPQKSDNAGVSAAEEVWAVVRNRLSGDKCVPSESISSSVVVDRPVKKEVAGRECTESMWLEVCEFCKEIGGKVLDELVEEALSELSCH